MEELSGPLTARERALLDHLEDELLTRAPELAAQFDELDEFAADQPRFVLRRVLSDLALLAAVALLLVVSSYLFVQLTLALAGSATSGP